MPVQPTYPGVYVQEVPSGVRTIMGVSTSVALFVGRAKWGPVNQPVLCQNYSDFERSFTSDCSQGDMARAVRLFFLNGGMQCYIMRIATLSNPTSANNANQAGITINDGEAVPAPSLTIQAKCHGALGNSVRAVVDYGTPAATATFNLKMYRVVTDNFGQQSVVDVQIWTGLSIDPNHPRFVEKYVDYKWANVKLASATAKRPVANSGTPVVASVLTGGRDGIAPVTTLYDEAYVLIDKEVDIFNLLILPQDVSVTMTSLWANASIFCLKRRAFLLMDPPSSWNTVQAATDPASGGVASLRTGLVKDYSAVFYPRVTVLENNSTLQVGPSGAIAGLMARIDSNRGVWKAPAGTEADLRGISGLEYRFSDSENGVLNPQGINTLRIFPNGIVNWGARTMDGDDDFASEWKYIPIRRTALFIEESLYRGLKWVVFEPNDEPLWSQIRLNAGAFMHDLFIQGAFQGQVPKEAYFVKCDKETTTQNDINKGIVNIWVGFAPLKPAEFVILYIQQIAGKINQ
jgi:phage tail sheath protein FI